MYMVTIRVCTAKIRRSVNFIAVSDLRMRNLWAHGFDLPAQRVRAPGSRRLAASHWEPSCVEHTQSTVSTEPCTLTSESKQRSVWTRWPLGDAWTQLLSSEQYCSYACSRILTTHIHARQRFIATQLILCYQPKSPLPPPPWWKLVASLYPWRRWPKWLTWYQVNQ